MNVILVRSQWKSYKNEPTRSVISVCVCVCVRMLNQKTTEEIFEKFDIQSLFQILSNRTTIPGTLHKAL
jgi:hypothetical protein